MRIKLPLSITLVDGKYVVSDAEGRRFGQDFDRIKDASAFRNSMLLNDRDYQIEA